MKGEKPELEVLGYLGNFPLFADLKVPSVELLGSACRFRCVTKREIPFVPVDPVECVYVVCAGTMAIVLNSRDGRDLAIDEVYAKQVFGDLEVLTRKTPSAGAVGRSTCELRIIRSRTFLNALDNEPGLARRLLKFTAGRLQNSAKHQEALAFMDARARLARRLLALDGGQRVIGFVTVSQEELASGTGLIRQTVAKALGEWHRNGWLPPDSRTASTFRGCIAVAA